MSSITATQREHTVRVVCQTSDLNNASLSLDVHKPLHRDTMVHDVTAAIAAKTGHPTHWLQVFSGSGENDPANTKPLFATDSVDGLELFVLVEEPQLTVVDDGRVIFCGEVSESGDPLCGVCTYSRVPTEKMVFYVSEFWPCDSGYPNTYWPFKITRFAWFKEQPVAAAPAPTAATGFSLVSEFIPNTPIRNTECELQLCYTPQQLSKPFAHAPTQCTGTDTIEAISELYTIRKHHGVLVTYPSLAKPVPLNIQKGVCFRMNGTVCSTNDSVKAQFDAQGCFWSLVYPIDAPPYEHAQNPDSVVIDMRIGQFDHPNQILSIRLDELFERAVRLGNCDDVELKDQSTTSLLGVRYEEYTSSTAGNEQIHQLLNEGSALAQAVFHPSIVRVIGTPICGEADVARIFAIQRLYMFIAVNAILMLPSSAHPKWITLLSRFKVYVEKESVGTGAGAGGGGSGACEDTHCMYPMDQDTLCDMRSTSEYYMLLQNNLAMWNKFESLLLPTPDQAEPHHVQSRSDVCNSNRQIVLINNRDVTGTYDIAWKWCPPNMAEYQGGAMSNKHLTLVTKDGTMSTLNRMRIHRVF